MFEKKVFNMFNTSFAAFRMLKKTDVNVFLKEVPDDRVSRLLWVPPY